MGQNPKRRVDRRELLALGAALGTTAAAEAISGHDGMLGGPGKIYSNALPWDDGLTDAPSAAAAGEWRYLNFPEVEFLTAAVDRLIPADPTGPSGSQAGVVTFIDRQLAGDYGNGAHFYLEGPWQKGTESQGYQSRFTPAQFYRARNRCNRAGRGPEREQQGVQGSRLRSAGCTAQANGIRRP